MWKEDNVDVHGKKYIPNDEGKQTLFVDDKLKVWQLYYQKLLNVEFLWNASNLRDDPPAEGPATKIITGMVSKAINKFKANKDVGPSGIIIDMIKAANNGIIDGIMSPSNHIVFESRVLYNWHLSYILNLFKGKGDALSYGKYRGLNPNLGGFFRSSFCGVGEKE